MDAIPMVGEFKARLLMLIKTMALRLRIHLLF